MVHLDRCLIDINEGKSPRVEIAVNLGLCGLSSQVSDALSCKEGDLKIKRRQCALLNVYASHGACYLLGPPCFIYLLHFFNRNLKLLSTGSV